MVIGHEPQLSPRPVIYKNTDTEEGEEGLKVKVGLSSSPLEPRFHLVAPSHAQMCHQRRGSGTV